MAFQKHITASTQRHIDLSLDEMRLAANKGVKFSVAGLHSVLGPHYKHIYWLKPNPKNRNAVKAAYKCDSHPNDPDYVINLIKG